MIPPTDPNVEPLECPHFGMLGPSFGSRHVAPYIAPMCGRVVQASEPLRYAFVDGLSLPDSRTKPPSYNVAPSQELYVIRHNHKTGERTLDLLRWGLIPHGCKDPNGGRKPINASRSTPATCLLCATSTACHYGPAVYVSPVYRYSHRRHHRR